MSISGRRVRRSAGAILGSLVLLGSTTAFPADAAPGPAFCGPGDVTTSYHPTDSAAGHRYGEIVLRNVSGHACRTHGFGGVSYVDGEGRQVGAAASRTSGFEPHLTLRPGQRAVSLLDEAVAGTYPRRTCRPRRVASLSVIVPEGTVGRFVAHRTTGCANPAVHLLAHTPYRRP